MYVAEEQASGSKHEYLDSGVVVLASLGCELVLDEVYRGMFDEAAETIA